MTIETGRHPGGCVRGGVWWRTASGRRPRGGPAEGLSARKWWDPGEMVLGMVRDQRKRQAGRLGDRRRPTADWLMILVVEVAELADAVSRATPPEGAAGQPATTSSGRGRGPAGGWRSSRAACPGSR